MHETRLQTKRLNVISQFKEEMSSLRGRVAWWFMSLQIQMNVFIRKPNLSVKSLIMLHAFSQIHVGGPGRKTQTNKETDKKRTECFVCITAHFSAICLLCVSSFISNQSLTISSKQKKAPQYVRLRFCSAPRPAIEAKELLIHNRQTPSMSSRNQECFHLNAPPGSVYVPQCEEVTSEVLSKWAV